MWQVCRIPRVSVRQVYAYIYIAHDERCQLRGIYDRDEFHNTSFVCILIAILQ